MDKDMEEQVLGDGGRQNMELELQLWYEIEVMFSNSIIYGVSH